MTDSIRTQGGRAVEIFAGETRADLASKFTPEIVDALIEVEGGTVTVGQTWNGLSFDPPPVVTLTADDLQAYAAAKRFEIETGGIAVETVAIATDRESQAMLVGAYNYLSLNQEATIQWKGETGFVTLGLAQIQAIASAVGAHVQACFAKEAEIVAEIVAGTITTTAAIDTEFAAL
jgi:hypothetical protein